MKKRKVAIFTGNRSEYGLLYPVIKAIDEHPDLEYKLIVGGAHLDKDFGNTIEDIQKDGVVISKKLKFAYFGNTLLDTTFAIGTGIQGLSFLFDKMVPDFFVVYGDRYEAFAAVIASTQMAIPTAHIEGGDITQGGVLDDSVRHAMTKLAHLHFTTNEEATVRIFAMGEEEWRVHTVGLPTLDSIVAGHFASPSELYRKYGLLSTKPTILFTQHSVTTEFNKAREQILPSLEALKILAKEGNRVIILYPCNDAGGRTIIEEIEKLRGTENIQIHKSLSWYDYHGILNICGREGRGVVVGNSSAGIKETPALGCPAVNIGTRQQGRLIVGTVHHVDYDKELILSAIHMFLRGNKYGIKCSWGNPYGNGTAGKKIAEVLATVDLNAKLIQKKMTY